MLELLWTGMMMCVVLWLQPPHSQSQPRLCPFNTNFSAQYECPVTKPAKSNLAWLKPIHATGRAGTGGVLRNWRVPALPTQLQLQRMSIYTLKQQTWGKSRELRPGETGMELWAGGWRAWQMKGAVMDGVVATVTAKAEKETKETGYGCLRRPICYIPASIYEFLLMC